MTPDYILRILQKGFTAFTFTENGDGSFLICDENEERIYGAKNGIYYWAIEKHSDTKLEQMRWKKIPITNETFIRAIYAFVAEARLRNDT